MPYRIDYGQSDLYNLICTLPGNRKIVQVEGLAALNVRSRFLSEYDVRIGDHDPRKGKQQ